MTLDDISEQDRRRDDAFEQVLSPLRFLSALSLETKIVLGILVVLGLWGLAISTLGIAALVWPMKIIVPSTIMGLVLLTWGLI